MSKITITEEFIRNGLAYTVVFDVSEEGCTVTAPDIVQVIPWEEMDDVEELSERFGETPVYIFKVIVQSLGQIYIKKKNYLSQLL
jgi:hypothetical protein